MFKVVLFVVMMTAGHPSGTLVLVHKEAVTEDVCKAFPQSAEYKKTLDSLKAAVPKGSTVKVTATCKKTEEETL